MTASFRPTNIEPCVAGDWNATIGNAHTRQSMGCLLIGCFSGSKTARGNFVDFIFFQSLASAIHGAWHRDAPSQFGFVKRCCVQTIQDNACKNGGKGWKTLQVVLVGKTVTQNYWISDLQMTYYCLPVPNLNPFSC